MATIKEMFEGNTAGVITATELLKELGDREGRFVWKQFTAKGGDFVAYVTADDESSYPNSGTQDGYWYELVIEGDGTWAEYTAFSSGSAKTIYSAHSNPNSVYGGGYLPRTQESGYAMYHTASCAIYGTTIAKMSSYSTSASNYSGNDTVSVSTASLTISGNKITIPAIYSNIAYTLRVVVCHV